MKTILVPIDYSEIADNALQYAVELAGATGASIVLLHVYHPPVPAGDVPIIIVSPSEFEEINLKNLREIEQKIVAQSLGKLKVDSIVRAGFVGEEVVDLANEKNVDLIVMGITGKGQAGQVLIGSNSISVIQKSKIPVLTIPEEAKFGTIRRLVLAYDCEIEVASHSIALLKKYIQLFDAELLVVDVVDPDKIPTREKAIAGVKFESALSEISHKTFYPESTDVTHEINSFAESHKADWLIMLPHKHSFLQSLFHKSNTKQVAFHTHIPILTLHQ